MIRAVDLAVIGRLPGPPSREWIIRTMTTIGWLPESLLRCAAEIGGSDLRRVVHAELARREALERDEPAFAGSIIVSPDALAEMSLHKLWVIQHDVYFEPGSIVQLLAAESQDRGTFVVRHADRAEWLSPLFALTLEAKR